MRVKAIPGIKVPVEHNARAYIDEFIEVDVEDTVYYQRRIADGDLIVVNPAKPQKKEADHGIG